MVKKFMQITYCKYLHKKSPEHLRGEGALKNISATFSKFVEFSQNCTLHSFHKIKLFLKYRHFHYKI